MRIKVSSDYKNLLLTNKDFWRESVKQLRLMTNSRIEIIITNQQINSN
jgi:hypothetical protein